MTPRIVHIIGRYLGRSETFIYDLITNVAGFEHHVLTTRTENLDVFPYDRLIVASAEDEYAGHVARLQASALVCHFGPSGLTGIIPGLVCNVPVITVFHGYDASMLLRDPAWVERYQALFRFGAHVIGVSAFIRDRLIGIGCPPARASVVHVGVDLARFEFRQRRPRRPGESLRLLMVSRLAEKKGIPVALRAARRLIDRGVPLSLRIGGEGEEGPALAALARQLGLGAAVTFLGALDRHAVQAEMAECDALLQPSVTAANGDAEGIPVVLMEAMASGVPVVASRHSGIPELVIHGHTGLLIAEHDDEALADAVAHLASDPEFGRRLALAARDHVHAEFNLAVQSSRHSALFSGVIDEHRPFEATPTSRPGCRRILMVRSVPVTIALSKLVVLRHRYPDAELWVLTRADSADVFDRCPLVSRTLAFPPGRLNLATVPPAVMTDLRAAGFEIAVVPLAGDADGYDNVVRVAQATGASRVIGLGPGNEDVHLTAGPAA